MSWKWLIIAGGFVFGAISTGIVLMNHLRYGSPSYANLADQCYSLKIDDQAEPFKLKVLLLQAREAYPGVEAFDPKHTQEILAEISVKGFGRVVREALCSGMEDAVSIYGVPR